MKKDEKAKYFSAAEKDSFAEFTVNNRFKKIFNEYCSGKYDDFLEKDLLYALKLSEKNTEKLSVGKNLFDKIQYTKSRLEEITKTDENALLLQVAKDFIYAFEIKEKKSSIKRDSDVKLDDSPILTLKEIFYYAPFLEAEFIFYHVILAEKEYSFKKENKNCFDNYDFYAKDKRNNVFNNRNDFIKNLDELAERHVPKLLDEKYFSNAVHYCLSANTSDLSQLNVKERFNYTSDEIYLLKDDTSVLYEYLIEKQEKKQKFKRFDIICDNAGKELFSDVYLACYFLKNEIVEEVYFHLKPYPFFVSDATENDFGYFLSEIQSEGNGSGAKLVIDYICTNRINVLSDYFWARPLCFDYDKENLKVLKELRKSDLIIVKGDLNYRRLVHDADWNYLDSFAKRTETVFSKAPIIAPRVLKSDVLIGIDNGTYFFANSTNKLGAPADQRFKGNGKWAVIQFRVTRYSSYLKRYSDRNKKSVSKIRQDKSSDSKNSDNNSHRKKQRFDFCNILQSSVIHKIGSALVVLLTIGAILATVYYFFFKKIDFSSGKTDVIDFSLLFTGYGFLLSGTILIPKFLLKEKIKEEFAEQKEFISQKITQNVLDNITKDLSEIKAEEYSKDADFSRMTAFLIKETNPIWALGWSLHSLKRYIESERNRKRKELLGFIDVLLYSIIHPAIKQVLSVIFIDEDDKDSNLVDSFACFILSEAERRSEKEKLRPVLSLIKDAADIEYGLKYNTFGLDIESDFFLKCNNISKFIGAFIRFVIFVLINSDSGKSNTSNRLFESKNDFIDCIFTLSRISDDERYQKEFLSAVEHISVDVFAENKRTDISDESIKENLERIYPEDFSMKNKIYLLTNNDYFFPLVE